MKNLVALIFLFFCLLPSLGLSWGADLSPQEKDYLQKAVGFLSSNHEADKEMGASMQSAHDQTGSIVEIRQVISHCRRLHQAGYAQYLSASPPASYKKIDSQIRIYARLRSSAFNELSRGFGATGPFVPQGGLPHIERGRDQYIASLRQGLACLNDLNQHMAQLEAGRPK